MESWFYLRKRQTRERQQETSEGPELAAHGRGVSCPFLGLRFPLKNGWAITATACAGKCGWTSRVLAAGERGVGSQVTVSLVLPSA